MNTIQKVLNIIKYIALADGPCGISDIGRDLNLSKNNVFRILKTLENEGWVEQNSESKKYSLTGTMMGLGQKALAQLDIQTVTHPYLHDLRRVTGETSTLSLRIGLERMFIDQVQSNHENRQVVEIGKHYKLWHGGSGKAILAFLSDSEIETVLKQFKESGVSILASGQAINESIIRAQIQDIKNKGYALTIGERVLGICALSAPIMGNNNQVIGSIGVSGPLSRFNSDTAEKYSMLIVNIAKKISSFGF